MGMPIGLRLAEALDGLRRVQHAQGPNGLPPDVVARMSAEPCNVGSRFAEPEPAQDAECLLDLRCLLGGCGDAPGLLRRADPSRSMTAFSGRTTSCEYVNGAP